MTKGEVILKKLFDDVSDLVDKNKTFSKENKLRKGQIFMNCLPDELCKKINQTEYDCFYEDSKLDKAMNHIFDILLTEEEYLEEVQNETKWHLQT